MGRPSKLTDDIQSKICEYLEKGVTIENIAAAVGITETTFYNWQKAGREAKSGKYFEFFESITRAGKQAQILAEQVAMDSLSNQKEITNSVNEVTETRLRTIQYIDDKGKTVIEKVPYEYRKLTKRTSERVMPASGDFALKYLSRRSPKQWAETHKQEVTGKDGGAIIIKTGMDMNDL